MRPACIGLVMSEFQTKRDTEEIAKGTAWFISNGIFITIVFLPTTENANSGAVWPVLRSISSQCASPSCPSARRSTTLTLPQHREHQQRQQRQHRPRHRRSQRRPFPISPHRCCSRPATMRRTSTQRSRPAACCTSGTPAAAMAAPANASCNGWTARSWCRAANR